MEVVNVYAAKTRLSQLVAKVEAGEDVVIARAGHPVARLTHLNAQTRILGRDAGVFTVPADFDAPLPPEVLDGFTR